MGKEPAGLRRWRLAQKRKKSGGKKMSKKNGKARSYGKRLYRKAKGYKPKSWAIPLAIGVGVGSILWDCHKDAGSQSGGNYWGDFVKSLGIRMTGWNPNTNSWNGKDFMLGGGRLIVMGVSGWALHKAASMTVNRYLPRSVKI